MATSKTSTPKISELCERIRVIRDELCTGLVERDVAIRLALLSALAGEHLLLIGPPGTAKSLISRRLQLAFADAEYFERLLTRFTVPEELFGPLSIKGLEEDRYERLTASYLPTASIAFLDEIFKANSAILNALLTLLNERQFDNGVRRQDTPLISVIGASNELPEGEELAALYDRFLLRLHVGPVSTSAFPELLGLRGESKPNLKGKDLLTREDLARLQETSQSVEVPADVISLLCELRTFCQAEDLPVSDRRWRKVVKLLQVSALSNGRSEVSVWDCWLLQHCLWEEPEQRELVYDWYAARVGAKQEMSPENLKKIVVVWEGRLKRDQDGRSQMTYTDGRLVYQDVHGKRTTAKLGRQQRHRDGERLWLAPANAVDGYYNEPIEDRTNSGHGHTLDELSQLKLKSTKNHRVFNWTDASSETDWLNNPNNWLTEDGPNAPVMEPTRFSQAHISASVDQLKGLKANLVDYGEQLEAHIGGLQQEITDHLWVQEDFAGPAEDQLRSSQETLKGLFKRVKTLIAGFNALPKKLDP